MSVFVVNSYHVNALRSMFRMTMTMIRIMIVQHMYIPQFLFECFLECR